LPPVSAGPRFKRRREGQSRRGPLCGVSHRPGQIPLRFHDGRRANRSGSTPKPPASAISSGGFRPTGCAPRSRSTRPDRAVAAIFGADITAILGLPSEPGAARPLGSGLLFLDARLASLGARAILPDEEARALLANAGIAENRLRHLRTGCGCRSAFPMAAAISCWRNRSLLESGFDEQNGVDWQEGCYIGHELTARTKYRGPVKKRVMPVRIEGPPPVRRGRNSRWARHGEMRSSRDRLGLALLRIEPMREGKTLAAGEASLVPVRPAWMRLEDEVSP
jgi:folate-binding protein YgfZ